MKNKLGLMMAAMVIAGWMQVGLGQSSTYQLIEGNFTWHEAKADAEARGGHLATITSQSEQELVNEISNDIGHVWIGGTYSSTEGSWEWVTGENWRFENWNTGDPNVAGGQNFLTLLGGNTGQPVGKWNDDVSRGDYSYILETPKVDLENGLVAYYPFNGNANDESGNGNDGEVNGATLADDRFGNESSAYDFDGSDDFIRVLDNEDLRLANTDFTINLWCKLNAPKNQYGNPLLYKRGSGNSDGWTMFTTWESELSPIGAAGYQVSGSNDPRIWTKDALVRQQWTAVTYVFSNQSGELDIYIDGIRIPTNGADTIDSPNPNTDSDLFIGHDSDSNPYWLHGAIDDIRIYDRALSEEEIYGLHELDSTPPPPPFDPDEGLVAYYPFNGNAKDASGNRNDGEVNGATLSDDRFGLRNSAYEFEQSNFVDVPASESLNHDGPFSVSLWVKMDKFPSDGSTHSIFAIGSGRLQIMATDWSGHRQQLHFRDVVGKRQFSSTPFSRLSESEYFHLSCSYDGATFTTYINGKIEDSDNVGNFVGVISGEIRVGKMPWEGGNHGLNGSIDDIRIYDRSFSEEEVAALYELESTPPRGLPPVIFDHPIGIDLRRDESVVLSVGHTGTPSFEYQWFQGGIKLQGQTKPYLFLEGVTPWDSGNYSVSISNSWGTAASNPAKIIVTGPPDISTHPISVVAGVGSDLLLTIQADGTPPLNYQWYKNGVALDGANKSNYFSGNVSSDNIGAYTVIVSNDFGQIESNEAQVTVGTGVRVSVDGEGLATIYLKTETDGFWVVEASSDLKEWTEVNAIKTNNGEAETTDIRSLINESRFYRARFLE